MDVTRYYGFMSGILVISEFHYLCPTNYFHAMKLISEQEIRSVTVKHVAELMMIASRTAPKARGVDNLVISMTEGDSIREISDKMKEIAKRPDAPQFFLRDAENILLADALILMGTKIKSQGVKICGRCGFPNCEGKDEHPEFPCTFNTGDLGIAMGSAVSIAMDHRVDNRIMYSVGQAVLEMKLLGEDVKIAFGIPLSVSSKSPFFDRK
jgi:uncharacterized ferredoxin-like protein